MSLIELNGWWEHTQAKPPRLCLLGGKGFRKK